MALCSVTRLNKCCSKLAMFQWLALNLSIYLLLRAAGIPLRDRRLASLDSLALRSLRTTWRCIFSDFRAGGVAWTAFMDCASLLSSTVRQQIQMHCLQACPRVLSLAFVELARVAWTVHAQTVPRRAGKPAVRKPTHARLVCLVKPIRPIPVPCFQSSSGCIESSSSSSSSSS